MLCEFCWPLYFFTASSLHGSFTCCPSFPCICRAKAPRIHNVVLWAGGFVDFSSLETNRTSWPSSNWQKQLKCKVHHFVLLRFYIYTRGRQPASCGRLLQVLLFACSSYQPKGRTRALFDAMADIGEEYRQFALAAMEDARAKVEAAKQTKCEALTVVPIKDWCLGSRQCHARCMLQQFYAQTADWRFNDRARCCAGRCVAWDLCQDPTEGETSVQVIEYWHGRPFVRSQDIDMTILGYHAQNCPLNGRRNVNEPTLMFRCGATVLQGIEFSTSPRLRHAETTIELRQVPLGRTSWLYDVLWNIMKPFQSFSSLFKICALDLVGSCWTPLCCQTTGSQELVWMEWNRIEQNRLDYCRWMDSTVVEIVIITYNNLPFFQIRLNKKGNPK